MKSIFWAASIVFVAGTALAQRDGFDCTQIDIAGAKSTSAAAINSRGDIAGQFTDASNVTHGFLIDHRGGEVSVIDVPGSVRTTVIGINAHGDMVGRVDDSTGAHGYLLSRGVFTILQFPGSTLSAAAGINARGDIVGNYNIGSAMYTFTLVDGVYSTVVIPGATATQGFGIDDSGDLAGNYVNSLGRHGFILTYEDDHGDGEHPEHGDIRNANEGSNLTTVDVPGARATLLRGITRGGHLAVGSAIFPTGNRVLLLEHGQQTLFNYPGAATTIGQGVNARGDFVGDFGDTVTASVFHGYVCR